MRVNVAACSASVFDPGFRRVEFLPAISASWMNHSDSYGLHFGLSYPFLVSDHLAGEGKCLTVNVSKTYFFIGQLITFNRSIYGRTVDVNLLQIPGVRMHFDIEREPIRNRPIWIFLSRKKMLIRSFESFLTPTFRDHHLRKHYPLFRCILHTKVLLSERCCFQNTLLTYLG